MLLYEGRAYAIELRLDTVSGSTCRGALAYLAAGITRNTAWIQNIPYQSKLLMIEKKSLLDVTHI